MNRDEAASFERLCVERSESFPICLRWPADGKDKALAAPRIEPLASSPRSWHVREMRRPSTADSLRETERRRVAALSASDRVELALQLGERDLTLYSQSHVISLNEARREMDQRRQARRRKSACIEALLN